MKKHLFTRSAAIAAPLIILALVVTPMANTIAQVVEDRVNPLPEHLKLKTNRGNLLGSRKTADGDVKYAYKGERFSSASPTGEVMRGAQKHGLTAGAELVEQRTAHSRTFSTNDPNTVVTEIISGEPQYYRDDAGNWWSAEYGTTTRGAFERQTNGVALSDLFGNKALAASQTFYSDDFPNSAVDGQVYSTPDANWENTRDNPSGTGALPSTALTDGEEVCTQSNQGAGTRIRINRSFFLFDTSALPDTAVVLGAELQAYVMSKSNSENDGSDFIAAIATNPASTTDLVASDFDQVKGTDTNFPLGANVQMQEQSNRIDIGDITTSAYNTWTLNSYGIANVSKTGVTKLGLAEGHDILNEALSSTGQADCISIWMSERSLQTEDPKLVVVHQLSAPIVGNQVRKAAAQSVTSTTTLANDSELAVALEANQTYVVDGVIFATSTSSTPDIKIGFSVPTGAIMDIGYSAANVTTFERSELLESSSEESGTINIAANTETVIKVSGTVKTSGTEGALRFRWSQATSSGSPTTVGEGSYLRVTDLDE